jgi:hypothetical protein
MELLKSSGNFTYQLPYHWKVNISLTQCFFVVHPVTRIVFLNIFNSLVFIVERVCSLWSRNWILTSLHSLFPPSWHNSPLGGQDLLILEAAPSHSEIPQSVGLLWTGDQPGAETSTWQHTTLTTDRQTSMPLAGFGPAMPVRQQPQTHDLNRAATGICLTFLDRKGEMSAYENFMLCVCVSACFPLRIFNQLIDCCENCVAPYTTRTQYILISYHE